MNGSALTVTNGCVTVINACVTVINGLDGDE